ncbi:GNAT family N-acetyltransferase [Virgibacillus kekensis]|uniref:GNAT family N-acetyltransferase n=1 Tax=Virgibacillus kekensis TaxID=202261 RepID=A0ABV9DKE3_9BACI
MKIRQLTPEDAWGYWDLRVEAVLKSPDAFVLTYEEAISRTAPVERAAERLADTNSYTYGAFQDGELVGIATLALKPHFKMRHKANILAMYVSPNARRLGAGKALLVAVTEKAKELKLEQLQLTVVADNEAARSLYEGLGFEVYGVEKEALKLEDGYLDEVEMVLFLQ